MYVGARSGSQVDSSFSEEFEIMKWCTRDQYEALYCSSLSWKLSHVNFV